MSRLRESIQTGPALPRNGVVNPGPTQKEVSSDAPGFERRLKDKAKALLPDVVFLSILHRKEIGRFPNLIRPRTFNEQILRRNLKPDPRYARLTDKLAVREYVGEMLGEEFLVPLIEALQTASYDSGN